MTPSIRYRGVNDGQRMTIEHRYWASEIWQEEE